MYGSENLLSGLVYFIASRKFKVLYYVLYIMKKKIHYSGKIKKRLKLIHFLGFINQRQS